MNRDEVFQRAGFPLWHGQAFQRVVDRLGRIVVSRTRDPLAIGLLEEGYSTKGFGIKAKSCDWGPFLGFVLAHPQFAKMQATHRDYEKQARWIEQAKQYTAFGQRMADDSLLYLSSNRLTHLKFRGIIDFRDLRAGETVTCQSPFGRMEFRLVDGCPPEPRWILLYGPDDPRYALPVHGMVNLRPEARSLERRKRCVTSDYDLWGVFPRRGSQVARFGMERQAPIMAAKTRHAVSPRVKQGISGLANAVAASGGQRVRRVIDPGTGAETSHAYREDEEFGNINFCTHDTVQALNREIRKTGYLGGNAVHHNDDLGNPYRDSMEQTLIAFAPHEAPVLIQNYDYRGWVERNDYARDHLVYKNPRFM